jgi:sigma-E factor negative regulatory protein RseC
VIEEYGTVVELKQDLVAVVKCVRNSACDHCPSSGACKMGDDSETMLVETYNAIGAQNGDLVKIATSTKHFLQSSFMLYIVPIIGLLIGAFVGQIIAEMSGWEIDPSLFSALTAVAFLILTFLGIRILTRNLNREVFMPRIVELQSQADKHAETVKYGH